MAKKFMTQDNRPDPIADGHEKADAVTRPSLAEVDAAIYGGPPPPDSGREVNKPISLDKITPDPIQPRREIPTVVRNRARAEKMAEWQMWHKMAENALGKEINLRQLLRGEGEAPEIEPETPPLVKGFMELAKLAASIYREGLLYAITVVQRGTDHYQIETGERRYQATTMLYGEFGDEKFSKIKARVVEKSSVWAQAEEKAARKPLTAIGTARQIALLIMELNKGRDGIVYTPFESFEGCDRAFYAQVANGNVHRIPKGESERVLSATGLKSKQQIQQYRALLDISDELWIQADEDDWAEFKIREIVRPPRDRSTAVYLSDENQPAPARDMYPVGYISTESPARKYPPMTILLGQEPGTQATGERILWNGREVEYLDVQVYKDNRPNEVFIYLLDAQGDRTVSKIVKMSETSNLPSPTPSLPAAQDRDFIAPRLQYAAIGQSKAGRIEIGQRRRNTVINRVFEVIGLMKDSVMCVEISKTGARIPGASFDIPLTKLLEMEIVNVAAAATTANLGENDDNTPPGGWQVGMQVVYEDSERFHEGTIVWTDGRAANIEIKGKEGDRRQVLVKGLRLAEGDEVDQGTAIDSEEEMMEAEDNNPSSINPDEPVLPDWAVRGSEIVHLPTNTIYTITGTVSDETSWYVRVQVALGEWDDLPLSECQPYREDVAAPASPIPPAPRERHPSLHPSNRTRVITEDQLKMGYLWNMATDLGMTEEAKWIGWMKITTPSALETFLRESGAAGTHDRIDAMYSAGLETLKTMLTALEATRDEMHEVARQMAEEKRARQMAEEEVAGS